ncbi:hypothetical protein Dhaf_4818 [Desulfitobacterium hafniense DCB-2]|uniref:Uncharacterized protein n=3 Tax=root TaxID=1 RepID=B8FNV9_DESHD|nr:hypothetical protein [Desulfitobacterium hafniense]ACL19484.1 hypothetical protein Dhaf_1429 [Desulfitobacterium hafniense DCB-2]ACL22813.1 hypothetical protein Dhaf_4818 [Desulfitobacterium hafniense DCB-2]EHL04001.1 hypothetical protein HMPREF0322_05288 [Desulfitobacterium hafniense DP7]MEA5023562.1 hypothetical protein [Desulfitobacterium hafniense]
MVELYVKWLADWIKNGAVNIQTGLPFVLTDIKIPEYREAAEELLTAQ